MSAPHRPQDDDIDDMPETLDAEDAAEEYDSAVEGGMDLDDEDQDADEDREEIILQNDSIAYFDAHKGSVFAIAQHPTIPSLIATGGGEGDEDDAPGKGYVFDTSALAGRPVLPPSYHSDPDAAQQQAAHTTELTPLFAIDGHTDSINALAFTLPRGEYLISGGLDGRLRAYHVAVNAHNKPTLNFVAEAQEVPEINWVAACPAPQYANAVAIGGSDGSVWVYTVDGADTNNPLQIVQTYFLHAPAPCTAGAWSPDGQLLATVAEDGSLHVWDVWGVAAAAGISNDNGQTVVSLTDADARFAVEGGLYSVAIDPRGGAYVAVGGAGGAIKIVGLPRLSGDSSATQQQNKASQNSRPSKAKAKGASGTGSQAGVILADIAVQRDSVETLAFSPTQPLLAAGSVDGSVAVYDASRGFAARKLNEGAHDEYSVVKVEFVPDAGDGGWLLTSCGMDGVVKRWDVRSQQNAAGRPAGSVVKADPARLVREWKGHRGEGEGGGVLGFVQGRTGERVVTAGDDGIALVFEA